MGIAIVFAEIVNNRCLAQLLFPCVFTVYSAAIARSGFNIIEVISRPEMKIPSRSPLIPLTAPEFTWKKQGNNNRDNRALPVQIESNIDAFIHFHTKPSV